MRVVVALGGHALLPRGDRRDGEVREEDVRAAGGALAELAAEHELVVVHGTGRRIGLPPSDPVTGPPPEVPPPLADLVAEGQGLIGCWLQQSLVGATGPRPVVTLVTQTVVDLDDPAFDDPTAFVGATYDEPGARRLADLHGWDVRADGDAWRRVVASPFPLRVVEVASARVLLEHGTTVVLAGGGGVPVVEGPQGLRGVDALVDRDRVAALVAAGLGADLLVLLTDADAVMLDDGTLEQEPIGRVGESQLGTVRFPAGSVGPTVAAARDFVRATGGRAAIGSLAEVGAVVAGAAGTQVTRDPGRRAWRGPMPGTEGGPGVPVRS